MYLVSEPEILRVQEKIQMRCQRELFEFLDAAQGLFVSMLSSINIQGLQETQNVDLKEQATQHIQGYKNWIKDVLAKAIMISVLGDADEFTENPPEPVELPSHVRHRILKDILQILSCGRDLSDVGLMFIGDVGEALSIETSRIDTLIEEVQYEKRKDFTQTLLEYLNDEQCYWIASMLWEAIHVDGKTHPQEYKYFENVGQLVRYNQMKLKQLEKGEEKLTNIPDYPFVSKLNAHIYKYIVEIVMIDGEYVDAEAKFIQDVGALFGYDKMQQDAIIQPVASALMLRRSLFAY